MSEQNVMVGLCVCVPLCCGMLALAGRPRTNWNLLQNWQTIDDKLVLNVNISVFLFFLVNGLLLDATGTWK